MLRGDNVDGGRDGDVAGAKEEQTVSPDMMILKVYGTGEPMRILEMIPDADVGENEGDGIGGSLHYT